VNERAQSADEKPRVSVVVPTRNRPLVLDQCLKHLLRQDFDQPWEIIVVDDGRREAPNESPASSDSVLERETPLPPLPPPESRRNGHPYGRRNGRKAPSYTEEIVRAREAEVTRLLGYSGCPGDSVPASRHWPSVRYVSSRLPGGPAAARNVGWRQARGEIVAFTDDDCLPAPSWLRAGVAAFVDGVAGVSGRVVMPLPVRPTDYQLNAANLANADFVTANCFYRRSALEEAGGFDERFRVAWREDSDLEFTLLEKGKRLVKEPAAIVVHPVRNAHWGISLRQQQKTQFNALLRRKHPRLYREHIEPSPWTYYPLAGMLLGFFWLTVLGHRRSGGIAGAAWGCGTALLAWKRLRGTRHSISHVLEMLVTSALIPPVSLFWRLRGLVVFRGSSS